MAGGSEFRSGDSGGGAYRSGMNSCVCHYRGMERAGQFANIVHYKARVLPIENIKYDLAFYSRPILVGRPTCFFK